MYINLFSAGNRRADFLAEDIRQKGLGDIVYFQSAEEALDTGMRGDKISVFLIGEEEKQNLTCYQTPYGPIQMEITTIGVNFGEEEELLEVKTEYVLGMNGQKVADCRMHIRVTPKGSKGTTFFES